MLMVGLDCVHPNHEKRPTLTEAARIRGLRKAGVSNPFWRVITEPLLDAPIPLLPARKAQVGLKCGLPWMTPMKHFS